MTYHDHKGLGAETKITSLSTGNWERERRFKKKKKESSVVFNQTCIKNNLLLIHTHNVRVCIYDPSYCWSYGHIGENW